MVAVSGANAGTITLAADATISGTVTNKNGEKVAGATVRLLDEDGNIIKTTTTNATGEYSFTGLGYGNYSMEIEMQGYVDYSDDVAVNGQNLNLDKDAELASVQVPVTDGAQDWTWLILLIVVIAIVVLILLLFLMKRRKREPAEVVPPVYMAGTKTEEQPAESAEQSEEEPVAAASACANCGAPLEPEYVLCPQCGTKR